MTDGIAPITDAERIARLEKARRLMVENNIGAICLEGGSSLFYFTGVRWGLSERPFVAVIPAKGELAWVCPTFEEARARELIRFGKDVRTWQEDDSPYCLIAQIFKDRGVAAGRVGVEETTPFVFVDGIAKAAPAARLVSGTAVSAGCRMVKDAHELALMRRAGEITLRAHRAVLASLEEGTTQGDATRWCAEAHRRLGMTGGSLVLFGPDAAFPHGTTRPRPLRAGDVVLIDGGGRLHGYASDITRTAVFRAPPTERQRRIWDVVRRAQEAAFRAARPGVEAQSVDAAARKVIEEAGFGPGYRYFTHRVGHGIGMDGHEWTYLVRGNTTLLRPGMCFSDEPGIYIPGVLGIRHEDVMTITETGAENLGRWSGTPEDPAVV